jgi:hypothetical protein
VTTFRVPHDRIDVLPFAVGDVVSIHIEPESRGYGYAPCPDGTLARVLGYSGIYYGKGGVQIADYEGPDVNQLRVSLLTADGKAFEESANRLRFVEASPWRLARERGKANERVE